MINYNFKIELTDERSMYADIVFTSGDIRGYRLSFGFTDNSKALSLKDHTLTVKAKRADGKIIIDTGVVTDEDTAYYDVKNSMIAVSGDVSFEIALSDSMGMYVTTKELFAYLVDSY